MFASFIFAKKNYRSSTTVIMGGGFVNILKNMI